MERMRSGWWAVLGGLVWGCAHPAKEPRQAAPPVVAQAPRRVTEADPAWTRANALSLAFSDRAASFSHDGKQLLFTSNRGGQSQLFLADADDPSAPARRVGAFPRSMEGPLPTWDGKAVLFSSDGDGDEQMHVYRLELWSWTVTDLTPSALNRDPPFLPERGGNRIFFTGRALNEVSTRIFSASALAPSEPQTLYTDPHSASLVDVRIDGEAALLVRVLTHQNQELVTVNLKSGKAQTLFPRMGGAAVGQAVFSPDGKRVFLTTDDGGAGGAVLALDARTGAELARFEDSALASASPDGLLMDRQGTRLAVSFDAGNHTEARLLDARTLRPVGKLELPLGVGELNSFSDDGKTLVLAWSTAAHPYELMGVDVGTGRVRALHHEAQPALDGLPGMVTEQVQVKSFDGLAVPTNVFRPSREGRGPVIVSLHGGPAGNSKVGWKPMARYFLAAGYAWVEPNIRGSLGFGRAFEAADDGAKRGDSYRDIDAVRAWLAAQPWVDASRLVVQGGSFGGFLVLNELVRNPTAWRAGVDEFGITDFLTFMMTTKGLVRDNYLHELGDPEKDRARLEEMSPLRNVERIRTPLFVYAGAHDPRVPLEQSARMVAALEARQVPVELMVGANEGHGVEHRENQVELEARLMHFLEKRVGAQP